MALAFKKGPKQSLTKMANALGLGLSWDEILQVVENEEKIIQFWY